MAAGTWRSSSFGISSRCAVRRRAGRVLRHIPVRRSDGARRPSGRAGAAKTGPRVSPRPALPLAGTLTTPPQRRNGCGRQRHPARARRVRRRALGLTQTNVYLVRSAAAWVLIDAGWARDGPRIEQAIRPVLGGVQPTAVLLTHCHPDHSGAAGELARRWGCPVWMHPKELPIATGDFAAMQAWAGPLDRWVILPTMSVIGRRRRETVLARGSPGDVARTFPPGATFPPFPAGSASRRRATPPATSRTCDAATVSSSAATRCAPCGSTPSAACCCNVGAVRTALVHDVEHDGGRGVEGEAHRAATGGHRRRPRHPTRRRGRSRGAASPRRAVTPMSSLRTVRATARCGIELHRGSRA